VGIDPATSDGKIAGLLHRSYVQCENIFTLDTSFILNRIGVLTPSLLRQLNDCLKRALEIS